MPELSIIVPVYNKERYLEECINSILNQTFMDFELILINDGSTDSSYSKCLEFERKDKRIISIDQKNAGVSAARNAGLTLAKGKFVGFIDADDTIDADMYQLLITNAVEHEADISSCRIRVIYPNKVEEPDETGTVRIFNQNTAFCRFFQGELEESVNNKVFLTNKVRDIRFEGKMNEDILYNVKALLGANKIVMAEVIKYNYLIRDNSISMVKFNSKYMESVEISAKMLELVKNQDKSCVEHAKAFDVVANISLLNLILLAGKEHYPSEYQKVTMRLKEYATFIKNSAIVRKKHRVAFILFLLSPQLYTWLLYLYGIVAKADLIHRTSASQQSHQKAVA